MHTRMLIYLRHKGRSLYRVYYSIRIFVLEHTHHRTFLEVALSIFHDFSHWIFLVGKYGKIVYGSSRFSFWFGTKIVL